MVNSNPSLPILHLIFDSDGHLCIPSPVMFVEIKVVAD